MVSDAVILLLLNPQPVRFFVIVSIRSGPMWDSGVNSDSGITLRGFSARCCNDEISELFFRRPKKPYSTTSSPIRTRRPDERAVRNSPRSSAYVRATRTLDDGVLARPQVLKHPARGTCLLGAYSGFAHKAGVEHYPWWIDPTAVFIIVDPVESGGVNGLLVRVR
jgi:hypothetical protein